MSHTTVGGASLPLLYDTKTGKVWKFYMNNQTGSAGFEGLTVEGLAYGKADVNQFYESIKNMSIEGVTSEKKKEEIKSDLPQISGRFVKK